MSTNPTTSSVADKRPAPYLLIALAVFALAGVGVVVFALLSSADGTSATTSNAAPQPAVVAARGADAMAGFPGRTRVAAAADAASAATTHDDGTGRYTRGDGTAVRDHSNQQASTEVARPVAVDTVAKARWELRDIVKDCARPVRARDMTLRGRLQTRLRVSVSAGRMKVQEMAISLTGFDDQELIDCARAAIDGIELAVDDSQSDVDSHYITLRFPVP